MRVLLADARSSIRSALRLLLEQEPGVTIVAEADSAGALLEAIKSSRPDVLVVDWDLPEGWQEGLISSLHRLCGRTRVVVLCGRLEARRAALDAGADHFVSKGDSPDELIAAFRECCDGRGQTGCGRSGGSFPCHDDT